jgi:hypothetical protein
MIQFSEQEYWLRVMPQYEQITCWSLHNSTGDINVKIVKTALFIYGYAPKKYL